MNAYLLPVFAVLGIVALNIYEQRRRAKMTPEERRREDDETRRELQIW